jgi:prepilin-type N-terminal cleavage/methylation domain-containing protein
MLTSHLHIPGDASTARRGGTAGRRAGFTLVELLVVIGIIAVLVSILLPTLRSVRRQANLVQCSSNMKQLSMAMLMYIQDNKGKFPAAEFSTITGHYPYGFSWPNQLVRLNYIKQPGLSVYKFPGDTVKKFNRNNVFRCPEGVDEDSASPARPVTTRPTRKTTRRRSRTTPPARLKASASRRGTSSTPATRRRATRGRRASWTRRSPPRARASRRFVGFQSGSKDNIALVTDPAWQRNLSMVKRGAELLMIVEAADQNWYDQTDSGTYPGNFLKRLGARHGKRTPDSG